MAKDSLPPARQKTCAHVYEPPETDERLPILLSAPHAVAHLREGSKKFAEPDSGALVLMLARDLGCCAIVNVTGTEDPNFYMESPYCDLAGDIIEEHGLLFCLDLHESAPTRPFSFAIGSGNGQNVLGCGWLPGLLKDELAEAGFEEVEIDIHPYAGAKERTVSSTVRREHSTPSMQLEMNSGLFIPNVPRYCPEKVFFALSSFLEKVSEKMLS